MKKGVKVLLSIILFAGIFSGFAGKKASAGDSNKDVKYSLYKPPLPPQEPPFFYDCIHVVHRFVHHLTHFFKIYIFH